MNNHRQYSDPAALLARARARQKNDGWPYRPLSEQQPMLPLEVRR